MIGFLELSMRSVSFGIIVKFSFGRVSQPIQSTFELQKEQNPPMKIFCRHACFIFENYEFPF